MSAGKKLSKDAEKTKDSESPPKPAEKPVSLRPLKFEEAVAGLLRTRPLVGKVRSVNQLEIDNGGAGNDNDR